MDAPLSFVPPAQVRKAASRGLELASEYGRAGLAKGQAAEGDALGVCIARARSFAKGDAVSLATIQRMRAFFKDRAGSFKPAERESDGGPSEATIQWQLWGGNAGRRWCEKVGKQADDAAKAEQRRRRTRARQAENQEEATDEEEEELNKSIDCEVAKVDGELGIVFGYAIVCKEAGEPYYDVQGDHIPEQSMLEATADYMEGDRMAKVMHRGGPAGQVVFGFPMTTEIASALDITIQKSGFIVGMKPDDDEILNKYRTGEFTGFSIGGRRQSETVVEA